MTFVKICGTTNREDANAAVSLGANALGFIFTDSPRRVSIEQARPIIASLPDTVLSVAVFRGESNHDILEVLESTGANAVQLHGDETADDIEFIRDRTGVKVIKALSAIDVDLSAVADYSADYVLLDAPNPGSGETFDWTILTGVPADVKILIAGGLNPENLKRAITIAQPFGVDVVSGVEESYGKKDTKKLAAFISAASSL